MEGSDYIIITVLSFFYTFGFLVVCCVLTELWDDTLEDRPWIPARVRDDDCLMPLFLVWPAFLWPLAVFIPPIAAIVFFIHCVIYLVCNLIREATTCSGIPLPQWWLRTFGDGPAASSSEVDLEMGPVISSTEDEGEGERDGGNVDSNPVGMRSVGSGESERPPSYTSAQLPRDSGEDDSGETDGLLDKSTGGGVEGK